MDAQVQVMGGGGGVYKSHGNFPDQRENFSFNERKFLQRTVEKFFTPIKEGLSKQDGRLNPLTPRSNL